MNELFLAIKGILSSFFCICISILRIVTSCFCILISIVFIGYVGMDLYYFFAYDFLNPNHNGYVEIDKQYLNNHFFANDITDGNYVIDFKPVYFHKKARYEFDFKLIHNVNMRIGDVAVDYMSDGKEERWMVFGLYAIGKEWFFERIKSTGTFGPKVKIALYKKDNKQLIFSQEDYLFLWDIGKRSNHYFRGEGTIIMPHPIGHETSLCYSYAKDRNQEYTLVFEVIEPDENLLPMNLIAFNSGFKTNMWMPCKQ